MKLQLLLQNLRATITLEPLYFLCCLTENVVNFLYVHLSIERSCYFELHHNDSFCEGSIFEKGEIFGYVAKELAWQKSPQMIVLSTLWIILLGLLCEKSNSKKPFILVPLFGIFFKTIAGIICTIFMKHIPIQATAILGEFFSLSGGQNLMYVIILVHIAEKATVKDRTFRIGILHIFQYAQQIFFIFWFWHRAKYCNILVDFSVIFVLSLLTLIYGFYVTKNELSVSFECPEISPGAQRLWQILKQVVTSNAAIFVILASCVLFMDTIVQNGEIRLDFLYFFFGLSVKLNDFETLHKYQTFFGCLGTIVGVFLFGKFFPLDDFIIWGLAYLHKIGGNLILAAAGTSAVAYLGLAVSSFATLDRIAIDSISTKVVVPEKLIKVQILLLIFGIFRVWEPLSGSIYDWIQKKTFSFFPSAYLWFGVVLYLGCLPLIVWLYFTSKRNFGRTILEEPTDTSINDCVVLNNVTREP